MTNLLKDFNESKIQEIFKNEDLDTSRVNYSEVVEKLEKFDSKQWAFFKFLGCDLEDVDSISEMEIDTDEIEYNGQYYLILTDDEADSRWEQELDWYLEECIYPELPENMRYYFDDEKWKRDARYDGRGNAISHYDGCEYCEHVDFEDGESDEIYIYKM